MASLWGDDERQVYVARPLARVKVFLVFGKTQRNTGVPRSTWFKREKRKGVT